MQDDQGLKLRGPQGLKELPVALQGLPVWTAGGSCGEQLCPGQKHFIVGDLTGVETAEVLRQERGQRLEASVNVLVPSYKRTLLSQEVAQVVQ